MRRPRLSLRLRLEGIQDDREDLRPQDPQGAPGVRSPRGAHLHALDQGRERPRRQHLLQGISFKDVQKEIGAELAGKIRKISLELYQKAALYAVSKGIIIADTKFEFGCDGDELVLIDEIFTPDSSRFWPLSLYEPGKSQPSLDKQFVRDYLETTTWDKNTPPPELPGEIVAKTSQKYLEIYRVLTGLDDIA